MDQHFLQSSYREKLIEHLFVAELLKLSWLSHDCSLEIARPEVDNSGYDLIAEDSGIVRHIQLRSSRRDARTKTQKVHTALSSKPSGCVIWILFSEKTLELGPFLFFGESPGTPLTDISQFRVARHTKGDSTGIKKVRPRLRVVPKSAFRQCSTPEEIYATLFRSVAAETTREKL